MRFQHPLSVIIGGGLSAIQWIFDVRNTQFPGLKLIAIIDRKWDRRVKRGWRMRYRVFVARSEEQIFLREAVLAHVAGGVELFGR